MKFWVGNQCWYKQTIGMTVADNYMNKIQQGWICCL